MISDKSDAEFQLSLWRAELCIPRLLAHPHYGPLMRAKGRDVELAELRAEWRERQERARARALVYEASFAD
ncbi:hypothetical protein ACLBWP_17605 [Microbacterium sp. M1A1_1b]|uniref:hypothetical protein n=1 Tax=Curtobacterium sp. VKM Ac-2922 TaxID=2929475 RepID=UPI001FB3391A|nr:hypothetical protein [Curtobacterium sp. VKM Ac-2922]MCJ1715946.1 hypothetical protein [Curtobacterium sp. VKM Ac-2922]